MNDYEDGVVLLGLDGLFAGHAIPTPNLQDAVFYPFDNVIPENLLQSCIALACKRIMIQEIMNVGPRGSSELCVIYQAQGSAFYADSRFESLTDNIQQAYVFSRDELNGKLLASQNFIIPVRMRSVPHIELHFQQPNAINPYMVQDPHFRTTEDGLFISDSLIRSAEVRPLTTDEIEELKRKQEEAARKMKYETTQVPTVGVGKSQYISELADAYGATKLTHSEMPKAGEVSSSQAEVIDVAAEGPVLGAHLADLDSIRKLTSAPLPPGAYAEQIDPEWPGAAALEPKPPQPTELQKLVDSSEVDPLTGQISFTVELEPKAPEGSTDDLVAKVSDSEVSLSGKVDNDLVDTLTGQVAAIPPFDDIEEKPSKRKRGFTRSNLDELEDK